MTEIKREKIEYLTQHKEKSFGEKIVARQRKNLGIGYRFAQDCRPRRSSRNGLPLAATSAGEDCIHEIAHRIDFRELRLGYFAAELLFKRGQQLDALHGVESEI